SAPPDDREAVRSAPADDRKPGPSTPPDVREAGRRERSQAPARSDDQVWDAEQTHANLPKPGRANVDEQRRDAGDSPIHEQTRRDAQRAREGDRQDSEVRREAAPSRADEAAAHRSGP